MLQTRVYDSHTSAGSGLQQNAFARSTILNKMSKPAVTLAFLVAVAVSAWLVNTQVSNNRSIEVPSTAQQSGGASELETANEKDAIFNQHGGSDDAAQAGNTNSVKLESVTNNGVTETKLEVNGQEVPVEPNSTTQVTSLNGSQSVTNLTTQNTQTSNRGFNFNSNTSTSSSFSHSFSSQNSMGGN